MCIHSAHASLRTNARTHACTHARMHRERIFHPELLKQLCPVQTWKSLQKIVHASSSDLPLAFFAQGSGESVVLYVCAVTPLSNQVMASDAIVVAAQDLLSATGGWLNPKVA